MGKRDVRAAKFLQVHRQVAMQVLSRAGAGDNQAAQLADEIQALLADELGGAKVYIGVRTAHAIHRRERVFTLREHGLSPNYIAARLGIAPTTVYRILRKMAGTR